MPDWQYIKLSPVAGLEGLYAGLEKILVRCFCKGSYGRSRTAAQK
jgi:hypothetical protein